MALRRRRKDEEDLLPDECISHDNPEIKLPVPYQPSTRRNLDQTWQKWNKYVLVIILIRKQALNS